MQIRKGMSASSWFFSFYFNWKQPRPLINIVIRALSTDCTKLAPFIMEIMGFCEHTFVFSYLVGWYQQHTA